MGEFEVEIKGEEMVKPSEKTWTGTISLSELDEVLAKGCVPLLYLYKPAKKTDKESITSTLKESLSKALVHFYPFTGRLNHICNGTRLEVVVEDHESMKGVPFTEAYSSMEWAHFGDDLVEAEEKGVFEDLFPRFYKNWFRMPIEEVPLLCVQLTHFRCGGFAIGLCWSHAVTDGFGAGHFFSEWTRIARGELLGMAPLHDRSLLGAAKPPTFVYKSVEATPMPPPPPMIPTRSLILQLSKSQIDKLKQTAAHNDLVGNGNGNNRRPYSRFEVLTAHLWRCASKARGHKGTKQNVVMFSVDVRKRMNPPLPPSFNGNGVLCMSSMSESDDLNSNPLGYACGKIRETIEKVTGDLVLAHIDYLKSLQNLWSWMDLRFPDGVKAIPDLMMTSWQNISFNELDFGWGNEAHMACPKPMIEGITCIQSGHEEGSVIVRVSLQADHADKFKDYFFRPVN